MLQRVASRLSALILLLAVTASAAQELKPKEALHEDKTGVFVQSFTPDGKTLIYSADDKLHFWDLSAKKAGNVASWPRAVRALSPDGKLLAIGVRDGDIKITDLAANKDRPILRGHAKAVNLLAFSASGKLLASAADDRTIRFWDLTQGKEQPGKISISGRPLGLLFSPDGKLLASRATLGGITIWDVASRASRGSIKSAPGVPAALAFSAGSKQLLVTRSKLSPVAGGGFEHEVVRWDAQTGKEIDVVFTAAHEIHSLVVSPDDRLLLVLGKEGAKLVDLASNKEMALQGAKSPIRSGRFSPDGKLLATGGGDFDEKEMKFTSGELLLWDVAGVGRK